MSVSNESSSPVERVAVEALPDRPRRVTPLRAIETPEAVAPVQPSPTIIERGPTTAELLNGAFAAIARVLAVRLQLMLAVIGAFVLAMLAMQWQTLPGLFVLIAWNILTVLPLIWLEYTGRPRR